MTNVTGMPLRNDARMRIYRRHAAKLARTVRAMYPGLVGGWTRRQWNLKVQQTVHNYLARMAHDDRRREQNAQDKATRCCEA
jgi:hypothetical protein